MQNQQNESAVSEHSDQPGPEVIKLFMLNSTEHKISTVHKIKMQTNREVSCFKSIKWCIILLINFKMPTIVGILTFMSRINFVLS